jgi:hypothetical protein
MAVNTRVRVVFCTFAIGGKCLAEHAVITDKEVDLIASLFRDI